MKKLLLLLIAAYISPIGIFAKSPATSFSHTEAYMEPACIRDSSATGQRICQGDTFIFDGRHLTAPGTYTDTLTNVGGCDSIVTLYLTVKPLIHDTLSPRICAGDSFYFDGRFIMTQGIYYDTLTGAAGCDSIVMLDLTVTHVTYTDIFDTICRGDSVYFGNLYLSSPGVYYDTLNSVSGCDIYETLHLTLRPAKEDSISSHICAGDSFYFGGHYLMTQGSYTDTLTGTMGCDSIVVLDLTVTTVTYTDIFDTICRGDSVHFGNFYLTAPGVYHDTLNSVSGCDIYETLYLTVRPLIHDTILQRICAGDSFHFGGHYLYSTGTFTDTLTTINGCDSMVTLALTVNALPVVTLTWDSLIAENILSMPAPPYYPYSSFCTNDGIHTIVLSGGLPLGGSYTGAFVTNDTIMLPVYNAVSGLDTIYYSYTDSNGCTGRGIDSFYLELCEGISGIADNPILLYPNPNRGSFTLQTSNSEGLEYTISDMMGHIIRQQVITSDTQAIDLKEAAEGVYTLTVKGAQPVRFVVVR